MKTIKKIRAAHKNALNGEPLRDGATRLQRLAYKAGQRSVAKAIAYNNEYEATRWTAFNELVEASVGANKQALGIIAAVAKLPTDNTVNVPIGAEWREPGKQTEHRWSVALQSASVTPNKKSFATTLASEADPLQVSSIEWPHGKVKIPFYSMLLTCSAPVDEQGNFGFASTHITLNRIDPDRELVNSQDLTGSTQFTIGADGTLSKLEFSQENSSGYVPRDPQLANVEVTDFLVGVHAAVINTAHLYGQVEGL